MLPFSPCEVLCRLYGWLHSLHSEEGGQVGGVGADHDQGKEPPQRRYHPGGEGPEDHYEYLWIMDAEKSAA